MSDSNKFGTHDSATNDPGILKVGPPPGSPSTLFVPDLSSQGACALARDCLAELLVLLEEVSRPDFIGPDALLGADVHGIHKYHALPHHCST